MKNITFSNCNAEYGYLFDISYQSGNQKVNLINITLKSIYYKLNIYFNIYFFNIYNL